MAKRVVAKLDWPGKPVPVVEVAPLTPEQQKRYDAGAELYKGICIGCHQPDGAGKEKLAPSLVDSAYVKGRTRRRRSASCSAARKGRSG